MQTGVSAAPDAGTPYGRIHNALGNTDGAAAQLDIHETTAYGDITARRLQKHPTLRKDAAMKSPLSNKSEVATLAGPGPIASFIRFVIFGGGIGVLCSFAVPLLAMTMPWAVSNAIITVASTLLCTELHARFTFAKGRSAGWREHWQSAGSATAAYLATSVAVHVLYLAQPSPGTLTEQIVYLGASGLAGAGRFIILRLYVFAGRRGQTARPLMKQGAVAAPDPRGARQPSCTSWPNGPRPQLAA